MPRHASGPRPRPRDSMKRSSKSRQPLDVLLRRQDAPGNCTVWVDYAATRDGTATTQQIMSSLAAMGRVFHREALILGGTRAFRHSNQEWQRFMSLMRETCGAGEASAGAPRKPLILAIQVRDEDAPSFWAKWMPAIRHLRQQKDACCRVVLSTRVREPASHYLSTYLWATANKVQNGNQHANPKHRVVSNGSLSRHYSVLHSGPRFEKWAPPHLQSQLFLLGGAHHFVTDTQTGKLQARKLPSVVARPNVDALLRSLAEDFDVVVPLERFNDSLLRIASRLGITDVISKLSHERVSPRISFYGGGTVGAAHAIAIAKACPNMSACNAHVRSIAAFDYELYDRAVALADVWQHSSVNGDMAALNAEVPAARHPNELSSGLSPRCSAPHAHPFASSSTHSRPSDFCHKVPEERPVGTAAPTKIEAGIADFVGACSHQTAVDRLATSWPTGVSTLLWDDARSRTGKPRREGNARGRNSVNGRGYDDRPLVNCMRALRSDTHIDISTYQRPSDAMCKEVRTIFYFAPPPAPGAPPKRVQAPWISPSPCNVAFLDNHTVLVQSNRSGSDLGWVVRRVVAWPFRLDAPRTAHVLKVLAPHIFPRAMHVLAGDIKCATAANDFPCAAMRPSGASELTVARNRCAAQRSNSGPWHSREVPQL